MQSILDEARELAALIQDQHGHVNLIPVNPIKERDYVQSGRKAIEDFKNYLEKNYRIVYNNTINTIHKGETQMRCPYCGFAESKVIDSRPTEESNSIRRRRECLKCQKRFTTYEKLEAISLAVIKKDQSRQQYDRGKVLKGIITACEKRPISLSQMEQIADDIESELYQSMTREIESTAIGEKVMEKLKKLDEVAYVRFASVYREFKDVDTFMEELKKILDK